VNRIVYVEDDDYIYMLKKRLERLGGFNVVVAQDGETGCAMAAAEQPDLIEARSARLEHYLTPSRKFYQCIVV
jgi:CheY-like chemotaxis protein